MAHAVQGAPPPWRRRCLIFARVCPPETLKRQFLRGFRPLAIIYVRKSLLPVQDRSFVGLMPHPLPLLTASPSPHPLPCSSRLCHVWQHRDGQRAAEHPLVSAWLIHGAAHAGAWAGRQGGMHASPPASPAALPRPPPRSQVPAIVANIAVLLHVGAAYQAFSMTGAWREPLACMS